MIVNPSSKQQLRKIFDLWRDVFETLESDGGKPLGFQLHGIALSDFLLQPEFTAEVSSRWHNLSVRDSKPNRASESQETHSSRRTQKAPPIPLSSAEDLVLLQAYQQAYEEDPRNARSPDKSFLAVMELIYAATYSYGIFQRVEQPPDELIHLLRVYLEIHPDLRNKLRFAMHHANSRMLWSQNTILHRMQRVIDAFLIHFGWGQSQTLKVESTMDNSGIPAITHGPFYVTASYKTATQEWESNLHKSTALAWVLWALFEYADQIGLGRPDYW